MTICEYCQISLAWGALCEEDGRSSALTFSRPSRLGNNLTINHHPNLQSLLDSSAKCQVCKYLCSILPGSNVSQAAFLESYKGWSVKLAKTRVTTALTTCLHLELWESDGTGFTSSFIFSGPSKWYFSPIVGVCNTSNQLAERAIWSDKTSTLYERAQIIEQWLQSCIKEHSACSNQLQRILPARFLDLGSGGNDSITLVFSSQIEDVLRPVRYVALSHCWGSVSKSVFRTTNANHAENMRNIPLSALPKTFKDAIAVTRALGVRFIWIDSLCIVQDDEKDWGTEAVKMAHIYEGSYFTIAATSAQNGDGGLFLNTMLPAVTVAKRNWKVASDVNEEPACLVRYPVASLGTLWHSPLSRRAWVVQEQILSTRLVHFTEHQMYYQCRFGIESEDGTIKAPGFPSFRKDARTDEGDITLMGSRDLSTPIRAINTWWSWVTEYTSRSLTFDRDRIVAFAGIVNDFGGKIKSAPVLGLWKETLWYDLCWQLEHEPARTADDCHIMTKIPTWSWLSIKPAMKVVPATGLDEQKWAELENKLRLEHFSVKWEGVPHASQIEMSNLIVTGALQSLGFTLPCPRGALKARLDFEAPWDDFLSFTIILDHLAAQNIDKDMYLLLLFSTTIYEYFILVHRRSGNPDTFERVGAGHVHRPRGRSGFFSKAPWTQLSLQ
ncbi:heterokaryon incompatibility protein-domain-containing protein [Xylariaceae sp. FL1651]|nr:heterokaryon incompatibility protein-domain-containing protein [Xylariaceae sp. FL1651]